MWFGARHFLMPYCNWKGKVTVTKCFNKVILTKIIETSLDDFDTTIDSMLLSEVLIRGFNVSKCCQQL